ncbi:hypothetical protein POM88_012797 [Heracleum sosnowskyi]|uniref:Helitron helicase-like domain-containing protein n=1 Tax=Heracleum sosnowskyi TaxID=360622 RepID=A0AAD8IY25_9APIA|nr:hypothetical protein POM88_012797 [Heracleum sosnowskyi]
MDDDNNGQKKKRPVRKEEKVSVNNKENIPVNKKDNGSCLNSFNTPALMNQGLINKYATQNTIDSAHHNKSIGRSPLSNITNISTTSPKNNRKDKGKAKMDCGKTTRNLFATDFNDTVDDTSPLYDEQAEESIIAGMSSSDDGGFESDNSFVNFTSQAFGEDLQTESESENEVDCSVQATKAPVRKKRVVPDEYATLGDPSVKCKHCNARMWKEERVNKCVTKGTPIFSMCCKKGDVKLPPTPPTPAYLMQLYTDEDKSPAFQRINNRLRWVNGADGEKVDVQVVDGLLRMLDETNELVSKFRMARDRFESNDFVNLKIELKVCRSESGRENHISPSDEVAGVMVGSSNNTTPDRDIIIHPKMEKLKRVSYIHPKLMALQYPILFPTGEDGYHNKIKFQSAAEDSDKERDMISMKDYYSYRLQIRDNEGMTPRLGEEILFSSMCWSYVCC